MIQRNRSVIWNTEQWKSSKLTRNRKKKKCFNENSLENLWDNIKRTNIHIKESQKEKRESKGQKT